MGRWSLATLLSLGLVTAAAAPLALAADGGQSTGPMHRYLALGDSYTIGQSVDPLARWPVQLAAAVSSQGWVCAQPLIIARTGWTTSELSAALHEQAPHGPFDLVTLLIGVNDQYRGYDLATFQAALTPLLRDAIALAGGQAGHVVVLSIPDWGVTPFAAGQDRAAISASITSFNALAAQAVRSCGAHWVDITPLSRDLAGGDQIAGDGLHPSGAMYARWVAATAPVVLGIVLPTPATTHPR